MRKIQKISLLMFSIPVIFLGCMEEKMANIKPKANNKTVLSTNLVIETSPLQKKLSKIQLNNNISIEELAKQVQANLKVELMGKITSTTPSFEVNENWQPYTKEDELIETAEHFLGVKYVWAANGPSSFDCSGFTRYVFNTVGVHLPRYSGHQATMGDSISFDELEKGDLVFFDTEKKFTGRVNHVGIYIGDNQFIHASSAGKKVMITSFSKQKFYKNKFLEGRRVMNEAQNIASLGKAQKLIALN